MTDCDFCGLEAMFFDKQTNLGVRANMCENCFNENGVTIEIVSRRMTQ
jgi:hypothetical protein